MPPWLVVLCSTRGRCIPSDSDGTWGQHLNQVTRSGLYSLLSFLSHPSSTTHFPIHRLFFIFFFKPEPLPLAAASTWSYSSTSIHVATRPNLIPNLAPCVQSPMLSDHRCPVKRPAGVFRKERLAEKSHSCPDTHERTTDSGNRELGTASPPVRFSMWQGG